MGQSRATSPLKTERKPEHSSAHVTTDVQLWQRYFYFRPWYFDRRVVDAGGGPQAVAGEMAAWCGGLNYAATFAKEAVGFSNSAELVRIANQRYPHTNFEVANVSETDYSQADIVLCLEGFAETQDPEKLLNAFAGCKGQLVISFPKLTDKFKNLIERCFQGRTVQYLLQSSAWPYLVNESVEGDYCSIIAVVGDLALPKWPRLGLAIPTVDQTDRLSEAIDTLCTLYPGTIHLAVVANGSRPGSLAKMRAIQKRIPGTVHLIELPKNSGYGQGANAGLEYLWSQEWYDYFGVVNDDVLPARDCVSQMVTAFGELEIVGRRPGILGPVSNEVSGAQRVDIGPYTDYPDMLRHAEEFHFHHHSAATQVNQVRGLFMLISPDCLSDIGGFDPRFGLGNFEDDDLNVRARLAGYTTWIADGAFLHHAGSSTFRELGHELGLDYQANIQRNLETFLEKWGVQSMTQALELQDNPRKAPTFVPLTHRPPDSGFSMKLSGESIDLVHQATDTELAAWIISRLRGLGREHRKPILEAVQTVTQSAA